jgi:hypothetical protein
LGFAGVSPVLAHDVTLITHALQCRQADADPDPLFPARISLPSQVDACITLLSGPALTG